MQKSINEDFRAVVLPIHSILEEYRTAPFTYKLIIMDTSVDAQGTLKYSYNWTNCVDELETLYREVIRYNAMAKTHPEYKFFALRVVDDDPIDAFIRIREPACYDPSRRNIRKSITDTIPAYLNHLKYHLDNDIDYFASIQNVTEKLIKAAEEGRTYDIQGSVQ